MSTNLQACLSYLSDIDFDRETLQRAREELAALTQRANSALPPTLLTEYQPTQADVERAVALAWNEAIDAAAKVADAVEANHKAARSRMETDIMRTAHAYAADGAGDAAQLIRALRKRTP